MNSEGKLMTGPEYWKSYALYDEMKISDKHTFSES
jgi:hypothetical protein